MIINVIHYQSYSNLIVVYFKRFYLNFFSYSFFVYSEMKYKAFRSSCKN
jgi:hypothetical protein